LSSVSTFDPGVFSKGADSMNALILMAVLAGTPDCPTIRIAAGGEELVIRKMNPLVEVSIRTGRPDVSHESTILWGDLCVEFSVPTPPELIRLREECKKAIRAAMTDHIVSLRQTAEASGGKWTETRKRALAILESELKKSEAGGQEPFGNVLSVRITQDANKWRVLPTTSEWPVLAEAFVTGPSP
jgi:hypothetical protein